MEKISVLQLGTEDWRNVYEMPSEAEWHFCNTIKEEPKHPYCIVFVDRTPTNDEINILMKCTKSYCLYVTENVKQNKEFMHFNKCRVGKYIKKTEIQNFLNNELKNYYPKPYGEKFRFNDISVARDFKGVVRLKGNCFVEVEGDYGKEYNQLLFWRNNIPLSKEKTIELWLEYEKDPNVDIKMVVTEYKAGTLSQVIKKWEFYEDQFKHVVELENFKEDGFVSVSLHVRGEGKFKIVALHDRFSRKGHGHFIPGGVRRVTSDREEIFFYFDPGDMKPPFNVYFSGYKTKEGFEAYEMMRKMGCPFLLISEARLEGGSFYLGSEEFENIITSEIKNYIKKLHFTSDQVIMCGLSMGTFGALYYSCDILPHAIIVGKPLANVGQIALNEKLNRPGGFPTSLDVLMKVQGEANELEAMRINDKFWNKFNESYWNETKFVVSYMIEDDYDADAYADIISNISSRGVEVYGKGIHGRHNDDTYGVVSWFKSQFDKILLEDFAREE